MGEANGIGKKTIRDIDVTGQRVLVRVDFNVPLENGIITDDTRVRESLATINYLRDAGAAVVLCSHLGRPKGKPNESLSLRPVAEKLGELLGEPVAFATDCVGPAAEQAVSSLEPRGVLLLENLRFHSEEEENNPDFARQLASLADLYVNDAFGTAHRAHASTEGVTHYLSAAAGFLLEKEVRYLGALVANPPSPFAAIVGGAKVSSKIEAIDNLLPKLNLLLIGGGMANTFLAAQGHDMQSSIVEPDHLATAKNILARASEQGVRVLLPTDLVVANRVEPGADRRVAPATAVPEGYIAVDIGPDTLASFVSALQPMKAVVWNGPMGVFEIDAFAHGTRGLAHALGELEATTVVGGGETAAAVNDAGVMDRITHVSTGGGASLEMLEGKELPGVAALDDA